MPRPGSDTEEGSEDVESTFHTTAAHLVDRVGQHLGTPLCVASIRPVDGGTGSRVETMVLEVRDDGTGLHRSFRVRRRAHDSEWETVRMETAIAAEFSLRHAAAWLDAHSEIETLTRKEAVRGTQLYHRRDRDGSLLCVQRDTDRGLGPHWCWRDVRPVTRIVDLETEYRDGDAEQQVALVLGLVFRDGSEQSYAVRFPEAEQAPVSVRLPSEPEVRPPWFPGPRSSLPQPPIPQEGWRPLPLVERADLGPLAALEVREIGESVLLLRSLQEQRLCARFDQWVCAPTEHRDDLPRPGRAHRFASHHVHGAHRLHGSWLAVERAVVEAGGDALGEEGRGLASLELYEPSEGTLRRQGAVASGAVSWTVDARNSERRQALRSFHRMRVERGCLRVDDAVTIAGPTGRRFDAVTGRRPNRPELPRAADRVAFHERPAASVSNLEGLWTMEDGAMRRVERCEAELGPLPSCSGVLPEVPTHLPEEAASCVRAALREARNLAIQGVRAREPCAATETVRGVPTARLHFRYEEGRI
ncbi:MAG: hypothetical protein AAGF12_39885, partial [Myxococcota bacterium]